MITKIKSLSFCLPIIIFIASIFTACTMLEENLGTGSVSFRIDNSAVQKIADAAEQENRNARTADEPRSLFMDVTISGGYSESKTVPLETEGTASFEGVPVGANITVSATAYYKEADTRQDLYQGQSKPFTVRNGENQVVFVLKRIAGDDDDSGSGSGSGSATANVLPENKIYVANTADGGASTNDGTEEHPLDTIENAVAKIHELIEDPNNSYNSGEEWGIVVMSDLQGGQILSDDADSDVTGFVLASKEATDVKLQNGTTSWYVGYNGNLTTTNSSIESNIPIYVSDTGTTDGDGSSATMNSGCVISNNNSGRGTCGGVYISGGTFLMQGGTISGSQAKNGAAAVYVGGRFEMSGDASIPFVDNKNYVTIPMLESQETPGIYSVMYPLVIAGELSETTAATIATIDPYSEFGMRIPYVAGRQCVTEKTSGLLAGNHTKIAVEPAENPSENWIINENGQLVIQ